MGAGMFRRAFGAQVLGKEGLFSVEEPRVLWPVTQVAEGISIFVKE